MEDELRFHGKPHAVVLAEDVEELPLAQIGPKFEHHSMFPERVNTEFIRVIDRNTIQLRVWERGSGEKRSPAEPAAAPL